MGEIYEVSLLHMQVPNPNKESVNKAERSNKWLASNNRGKVCTCGSKKRSASVRNIIEIILV